MPIYEYQCQSCGHEFEIMQKMSEAALIDCPECSRSELKKLMSASGFQLKGGGWYATDFKDGGSNKAPAKTDSAPAPTCCSGGACGGHKS